MLSPATQLVSQTGNLIRPPIFLLLACGCPATVFRRIAFAVVDSVDRTVRRFFAHVLKKTFKAFKPAVANCNATSAVVGPACEVLVCATLNHVAPRIVRGRAGLFVRSVNAPNLFTLKAAATATLVHRQISPSNKDLCAT